MSARRACGLAATVTAASLLFLTACGGDADRSAEEPDANADSAQHDHTGAPPVSAGDEVSNLLDQVRAATVGYHDLAAAEAAGFELEGGCVPGMGYHYVNGLFDTAELDPAEPNILVYAPDDGGDLRLVAVEYGTFAEDAELFGVAFDPPGDPGPPFSTLHAWVWLGNPDGTFHPVNPLVSCD